MSAKNTKAGFVAIIGKPNAGKSTLLNSILGIKLSIVTPKPQTTRKNVLGIHSTGYEQIIFLDTPGILKPKYEMQKSMMSYVNNSINDADAILVILDLEKYKSLDQYFDQILLDYLKKTELPKILVLNKIDTLKDVKNVLPIISNISKLKIFDDIVPVSALKSENISNLLKSLIKYLPESDFFYDPEMLSTQNERFFVSELIREEVFKSYSQELPYSTEINITDFKEREKGKWYISADIIIERKSQKMIIIGKKGDKLKSIGQKARAAIEQHLEKEIYLELFVKVRENWRDNKNLLNSYGY